VLGACITLGTRLLLSARPFFYGESGHGYDRYNGGIIPYHGRLGIALCYRLQIWQFVWDLMVVACIVFIDTITEGQDHVEVGSRGRRHSYRDLRTRMRMEMALSREAFV